MSRNRSFERDGFNSNSSNSPSWLEEFAVNWEKSATTAVEEARKRQADSDYYSQIVSIVGGKKKHATVDSIVKEYQELTGLNKYLQTLAEKESSTIKTAQTHGQMQHRDSQALISVSEGDLDLLPEDLSDKTKEKIKMFVNNKINSYSGYVSIPAIQDDLLKVLRNDGLEAYHVYDPKMAKFIGLALSSYEQNNQMHSDLDPNLGKAIIEIEDDGSNKDFLHSLQNKNK
jgi:hypothetical protein